MIGCVYTAEKKHTWGGGKVLLCPLTPNLQPLLSVSSRGENSVHEIQYREMNSCLKADDLDLHNSSGLWVLRGSIALRFRPVAAAEAERHSTSHSSGKKSQTK